MRVSALLALGALCGATVFAQNQPLPPELQRRAYVRRVSAGVTFTVPVLTQFVTGFDYFARETPPLEASVESNTRRSYAGGGLTLQFAVTERTAINLSALLRKAEFTTQRTEIAGVDNPNTLIDDRVRTDIRESVRLRYLDFPILVRYYTRGHHQRGDRWFLQAGPNFRSVRRLRNNIKTTAQDGTVTESNSPLPPYMRRVTGITAGFGAQLIDPVGVRVIPEVRYTRWLDPQFKLFGVQSRRDHIEVMISFTF